MAEPRSILPIVSEETALLKWFEAFINRRYQCSCFLVIPTESVIRVELEQQMCADSSIVHGPALIVQKGFQAFRHCLKGHPLYLNVNSCGILRSRSFWKVLKKVRINGGRLN